MGNSAFFRYNIGCHFISRVIVTLKIGSFKIAACERCVFAHHFNCERRTHQIIHQFSYWWFSVCVLNAKFIIATDSHKKPRKWHKQIVNLHKIERYHGKLCDELLLLRLSPCIFMTERRKKNYRKKYCEKGTKQWQLVFLRWWCLWCELFAPS